MSEAPDLRKRDSSQGGTPLLPVLLGGAALVVLLLGGGLLWFVREAVVGSEAYQMAETFVLESGSVRSAVGDSISFGFLPTGEIESDGQSGEATLTLNVNGEQGTATLQFALVQEEGAWRIVDAAMRSPQGGVTDLVKGGRKVGSVDGPDPQAQMHIRRAQQLVEQGRVEEGLAELQSARTIDPESADLWHIHGRAMLEYDDLETAKADFQHALTLDPQHAGAHEGLGFVLQAEGDLDGALKHLDRYVELLPNEGHAWFSRGAVLSKAGRSDEALEHAKKACELGWQPGCDIAGPQP